MRLSKNFNLSELLNSNYAQKNAGDLLKEQQNPSIEVVKNLKYLVQNTLQPLRVFMRAPLTITSGYRCSALNDAIGGSRNSQHLAGQAADIQVRPAQQSNQDYLLGNSMVNNAIEEIIGKSPRKEVNSNFHLFALACLHLKELGVDQIIHEHGEDGCPKWIHISSVDKNPRGEILKATKSGIWKLEFEQALLLGC